MAALIFIIKGMFMVNLLKVWNKKKKRTEHKISKSEISAGNWNNFDIKISILQTNKDYYNEWFKIEESVKG